MKLKELDVKTLREKERDMRENGVLGDLIWNRQNKNNGIEMRD